MTPIINLETKQINVTNDSYHKTSEYKKKIKYREAPLKTKPAFNRNPKYILLGMLFRAN